MNAVRIHYTAIEADWARFYGRDLAADLYGPEAVGFRRIAGMFEWLPPDAAVWRSMKNSWSDEKELLATQIEVIDALRRAFIMAHSKQGTKPPEPVRIPRPWETAEKGHRRGTRLTDLIREMKLPVHHTTRERKDT